MDPVKIGVTIALMAVQTGLQMMRKTYGPRLDDLSVTLADYGAPLPRIWGKRRLQGQVIWAEDLREKKKTSKGKGGKQVQYQYFGTWAIAICDQDGHDPTAFDEITKVWFDRQLVYDKTGAGPISIGALFGDSSTIKLTSNNFRVYKGTNTQMPDPRMEAWCENKYGLGTCPAYRLTGLAVFENIPLEKVGNRVPQVSVEVVRNPVPAYPLEYVLQMDLVGSKLFGGGMLLETGGTVAGTYSVYDLYNRVWLFRDSPTTLGFHATTTTGVRYGPSAFAFPDVIMQPMGGAEVVVVPYASHGRFLRETWYCGGFIWFGEAGASTDALRLDANSITAIPIGYDPDWYFDGINPGDVWVCGVNGGFIEFTQLAGGTANFSVATTGSSDCFAFFNDEGNIFVHQDGDGLTKIVDPVAMATIASTSGTIGGGPAVAECFLNTPPGSDRIYLNYVFYDASDFSVISTVDTTDWGVGPYADQGTIYSLGLDAVLSRQFFVWRVDILYLNRWGSNGMQLADVVNSVSRWCGVTGQDTTQLTQPVMGYSVTRGAGKEMIDPLLDIHDVDAGHHNFDIKFVNRGGAPSGPILLTENFALSRKGEKRYNVTYKQPADLPLSITFNFVDELIDDQPNTARSARNVESTTSTEERTIDLTTYHDTPDGAQQKVDRFFRREWNSRERTLHKLTYMDIAIEPADVRTISLDGLLRNVRADKTVIRKDHVEVTWIRDETAFAQLNPNTVGAPLDGNIPDVIFTPPQTNSAVLDLPMHTDADDDPAPLLHVAAGGYASAQGWTGATVYDGSDGTFDTPVGDVDGLFESQMGFATNTLADANYNNWDRVNTLNVMLNFGTLTTVTEDQIDADPLLNMAVIGQEYIQFTTAVLQGDGSYTLSGFKRGRRGTEWACGTHVSSELFALADNLVTMPLTFQDIGADKDFAVQSYGLDPALAPVRSFTPFTGASLKSYAPADIHAERNTTTGDWTFTWDRRSRLGANWNGSTIPLPETVEDYDLVIMNGTAEARVINVNTKSATYTSAQQVADWGSNQTTLDIVIYQRSSMVGRGFGAALTV